MSVECPNGHASDDTDYCSVCGVRIGGASTAPAAAPDPTPAPASAPAPAADGGFPSGSCPNCSTELEPDTRFCEVCGYDPSTGSLPEAPVPVPADLATDAAVSTTDLADPATDADGEAAAAAPADDAQAPAAAPVVTATGTWVAVVTADRAYYDRNQVSEVQFPLGVPARTIELPPGGPLAIGRRSRSRGTSPAIDLAGPPEDAAVSHTHASLLPADGGGWELVDHVSTNGTYLNESPHPVAANEPLPVTSGDRIYVGAWTKITLELHD